MMSNGITSNISDRLGALLVVDDEDYITELLKFNLENEGYSVEVSTDARKTLALDLTGYRLLIVDAMSQEFSGRDLLRSIKSNALTSHIPAIILSHSDSEDDILAAFNVGADDYILKPFSLRELIARVRSVLRRNPVVSGNANHGAVLQIGPLHLDLTARIALYNGKPLALTKTEFAILSLLAKNKNTYFNRQQIYKEIWADSDGDNSGRLVDTNISRLRKKLGDAASLLVNKSGMGYCIQD